MNAKNRVKTDILVSDGYDGSSKNGTKVPSPEKKGTDTLVSDGYDGAKVLLPRFYGIFE